MRQSSKDFYIKLKHNGTVLALLSGILYGTLGFYGMRLLESGFSISSMLFWRFLLSAVFTALMLKLDKQFRFIKTPKKLLHEILLLFSLGILLYGGGSASYFIASTHLGTGLAMVIFYSYPICVALLSWGIDRIKPDFIVGCSLLFVLMGCVMIASSHDFSFNLKGIIYALISCVAYAIYVYVSKRRVRKIDHNFSTFVISLSSALLFGILSFWDNSKVLPSSFMDIYYILAIAILATALPILLFLKSLNFISATRASVLSVSEPIVTLLIGICILNEVASGMQIIGVFLIIAGALSIQFEKKSSTSN